jgi:hypothetical protein
LRQVPIVLLVLFNVLDNLKYPSFTEPMSEENASKSTQERSPRFPADTLEKTIELIGKLFAQVGRSPVPAEAVAKALDYAGISGASKSTQASLSAYGLLERNGHNQKVSDLAIRIIRPISPKDKQEAINKACFEPSWAATIQNEHSDCSESVLTSVLVHKGFTDEGAKRAARIFKENIEFLKRNGTLSPTTASPSPSKTSVNESPKAEVQKQVMAPSITASELPVPIGENLIARVPFPMSEEDFDLFIGTLNLWKKKLTKQPSPAPRDQTHVVNDE